MTSKLNEAFKRQLFSSNDFFQAKRWEGKPLAFKIKYLYANYTEIAVAGLIMTVICPAICAYKMWTYSGSRREAVKKYRSSYIVVRDDHPNIEQIRKEKELGREFFPQY